MLAFHPPQQDMTLSDSKAGDIGALIRSLTRMQPTLLIFGMRLDLL